MVHCFENEIMGLICILSVMNQNKTPLYIHLGSDMCVPYPRNKHESGKVIF
jgi:hypothetical protein